LQRTKLIISHINFKYNSLQAKLWITFCFELFVYCKVFINKKNYFHLKRVMAKLQHMCLCECDDPLQIKIINYILSIPKCRAAGNRTQSTPSRRACTTGILRPVFNYFSKIFLILGSKYFNPFFILY